MQIVKRTEITKKFEKMEWDQFLGEVPPLENIKKNSNICLFGDGQWLVRKNRIGVFCRKYNDLGIPGLDDGPEPFFIFDLPKIPFTILQQQVSFYREVMTTHNGAEAYSIVLYDLQNEQYFLEIPKQRISGAQVSYAQDELREKYPSNRYIEVISAHSHNSMQAFFSGVDDADEKGDLIYMVMGKLDNDIPTFKIRANVAGKQASFLNLEDIFEITQAEWDDRSPGWKDSHSKDWMEMLNVAADYRSPHHQNLRFRTNGVVNYPDGSNRPTHYGSGKITSFSNAGNRYVQGSFHDFFDYGDSFSDDYDKDTMNLRLAARKFSEDAILYVPEKAIANLLNKLISLGYSTDLFNAVDLSAASKILWAQPSPSDDDDDDEDEESRYHSFFMKNPEEPEEDN